MKARNYFEILGLAQLLILPFIFPLLTPHSIALLHNRLAFSSLLIGLLVDAVAVFVVCVVLILAMKRLSELPRAVCKAILTGLVYWWISVCICFAVTVWFQDPWAHRSVHIAGRCMNLLMRLNFTFPAFFAALAILRPAATNALARVARMGLASFSACALWVIPQLVSVGLLQPVRGFDHSGAIAETGPHKRIVWILMDELSQDLVFDHPLQGASYPNLTRMRSASVTYSQVDPLGKLTDHVVPSILQGALLDSVQTDREGNLLVHEEGAKDWSRYDTNQTLFQLAKDRGWNPGVAGWFNPYCRIFPDVLTACSWRPGIHDQLLLKSLGAAERGSPWQNATVVPVFFISQFWAIETKADDLREENVEDYKTVLERSKQLINNRKIHFVFLHLPVPHPPGLYDRRTHQLCACGNYFDNLGLADETLGKLLREIDATGDGGRTTVIVSSDHSWRTWLWRTSSYWTEEEDRIAQHFSDTRPVFLVRFPGQQQRVDVTAAVPELAEHDLIAGMLEGKITSAEELVRAVPMAASAAAQPPGLH